MKATVTVTYHAAEVSKLNQRIAELEEELVEAGRAERRLAIAEASLKNVDEGWAYREYEERLLEERL